jgi:hypothetical protein
VPTDPKWTIVADPPEPYADEVRLILRAYDEDAAWAAAFAQLGAATKIEVYPTLCICLEDPNVACDADPDDHHCICTGEDRLSRAGAHPLCRLHGLEDVVSGCYDTSTTRRRQINWHLV